ncbi:hypothetical protein EFA69_16155 [Rufibacter immobilis]|uniref:Uncharacterized protein n=2 Tax=Rufibacter immobilis TaxID=1348778 RepID=A0A3M9MQ64_9BACT|nr:hypothetical protein EFA69_16155 [Rufibacter immobilis]
MAWIESNQVYEKGLELYQKYGSSSLLKKVLATGPSEYNRGRLLAELQQLYASVADQEEQKPALLQLASAADPDGVEEQLVKERSEANKVAAALKSQLPFLTDPQKRKAVCFKILDLYDRNSEIWAMLEYKAKHGYFPHQAMPAEEQEEEAQALDRYMLEKMLQNIRPKISRIKNDPTKKEQLKELQQEKFRLEQLLEKANAV